MQRSDIEKLARTHAFPAVTILMPLQQRRPGNREDALRLRHLLDAAVERLLREQDRREVATLIEHLYREVQAVDLKHPRSGVAIFVTEAESHRMMLPFPVRERVVINETFATRDLLVGLHRTERSRVLVLSRKQSRLYDAVGGTLAEVVDGGFPMEIEAPVEADAPHRDLPIHEEQHAEAYRFTFRTVDRALAEVQNGDPLPIVLVGVERDLAYFGEVSRHTSAVIGSVTGNHVHDTATRLAELVAPVIDAHFAAQRRSAVDHVNDAIGARHAALGIEEVWQAASEGRGHVLVVEQGFTYPARIDGHTLVGAAEGTPGGVDDAVDEIVEAVLLHAGEVTVVDDGALAEHGRIALTLRY